MSAKHQVQVCHKISRPSWSRLSICTAAAAAQAAAAGSNASNKTSTYDWGLFGSAEVHEQQAAVLACSACPSFYASQHQAHLYHMSSIVQLKQAEHLHSYNKLIRQLQRDIYASKNISAYNSGLFHNAELDVQQAVMLGCWACSSVSSSEHEAQPYHMINRELL